MALSRQVETETSKGKGFEDFLRTLFRLRKVIYKLIWPDLFFFLGTYFSLNVIYKFALSGEKQVLFEEIVRNGEKYGRVIPVSMVLGLYALVGILRCWDQIKSVPCIDPIAIYVSANIHGQDAKRKLLRRTIMRYCCLSLAMNFALVSSKVKKRFLTLEHLMKEELLFKNEKEIIVEVDRSDPDYCKQSLPIIWACSIITTARKEGIILDDSSARAILEKLTKFKTDCNSFTNFPWTRVSFICTQISKLVVYSYLLAIAVGSQRLLPNGIKGGKAQPVSPELDFTVPFLATLQYFFYMGWLKIAEFFHHSSDEDDILDLNAILDRNLKASNLILEQMQSKFPFKLSLKQCWDEINRADFTSEQQYGHNSESRSIENTHGSNSDGEDIVDRAKTMSRRRQASVPSSINGDIVRKRRDTLAYARALNTRVNSEWLPNENGHVAEVTIQREFATPTRAAGSFTIIGDGVLNKRNGTAEASPANNPGSTQPKSQRGRR